MVRSEADKYEVSSWDEYPIMFMCTPVEFQVDPTNNVPVAQKNRHDDRDSSICSMTTVKVLLKRSFLSYCHLQPNPYLKLLRVQVRVIFFCAQWLVEFICFTLFTVSFL